MARLLEGKTALVLGVANRWSLAWSIACAFKQHGAEVALTYQSERQRLTVEELASELGAALVLACDVTREEDIQQLQEQLGRRFEVVDTVVHSIAFAPRQELSGSFLETSRQGFLIAHEVSVYSLVAVSRAVAPLMKRGGSVITLSYLGANRVVPNYNVMGVAKAALESSVRYLAHDLGPAQIRVNAISAGPVKTASARAIKGLGELLEHLRERAPLRRNTEPSEIGDVAVFLASDLSRGVTGNVLYVDAGYHVMAF